MRSSADKTSANLGFDAKLWLTADKLRKNMDAAEYKHVVLGLIFLKYISDAFEEIRKKLAESLLKKRFLVSLRNWQSNFKESERLEKEIRKNLKGLGYEL